MAGQVPGEVAGLSDEQLSLIATLSHQVKFGRYMQLSTDTVKMLLDAAVGRRNEG